MRRMPWGYLKSRSSQSEMRMFFFHPAGGNCRFFWDWQDYFPSNWDLALIEYPGHGVRMSESCIDSAQALSTQLLMELQQDRMFERPFAFFGHSMGATVAFELAQMLEQAGMTQAAWIGLSGRSPVHHAQTSGAFKHLLGQEAFIEEVRKLGGIAQEVFDVPELLDMILGIMRIDFKLTELHVPNLELTVGCPLSGFGGLNDPATANGRLASWSRMTRGQWDCHEYPGGHFYLNDHIEAITRQILADVRRSPTFIQR